MVDPSLAHLSDTGPYDCTTCGACCVEAGPIPVMPDDKTPARLTASVRRTIGFSSADADLGIRKMKTEKSGRCTAFKGDVGTACQCAIYAKRPSACALFEPGTDDCRECRGIARQRFETVARAAA